MLLFSKIKPRSDEVIGQPVYIFSYNGNMKSEYLTARTEKDAILFAKSHKHYDNTCALFPCDDFRYIGIGSQWLGSHIPRKIWGKNLLLK